MQQSQIGQTTTRAQRRRFDRLGASVDRTTAADALFFERRPGRAHRVRLAAAAEIEQNAIMAGEAEVALDLGARWIVLVKQIAPGIRVRAFAPAVGFDDFDLDEADASALFEAKAPPGSRLHAIETQMRAALLRDTTR